MRLIDELRAEHEVIDAVVGSLRTYVDLRIAGAGDPATLALLDRIEAVIGLDPLGEDAGRELKRLAVEYSRALWHHIDAENSVLFPESEARLRRHGVLELPSREMTDDERDAMASGQALVLRYPPVEDIDAIRGDGCVCCPALVEGCPGLERSWWNESEWDEFEDHMAAD